MQYLIYHYLTLGEEPKLELNKGDEENQHFREIAFITGGMIVVGYVIIKIA